MKRVFRVTFDMLVDTDLAWTEKDIEFFNGLNVASVSQIIQDNWDDQSQASIDGLLEMFGDLGKVLICVPEIMDVEDLTEK